MCSRARCDLYELSLRPRGLLLLLQCPPPPPTHSMAWLYWFPLCVVNKIHNTSKVSNGNLHGYYCNFGSLRYGNEYCVPCCAVELYESVGTSGNVNLRILCRNIARRLTHSGEIWQAPLPSHCFVFTALHEPMVVQ